MCDHQETEERKGRQERMKWVIRKEVKGVVKSLLQVKANQYRIEGSPTDGVVSLVDQPIIWQETVPRRVVKRWQ
jgi:hypothetical protein